MSTAKLTVDVDGLLDDVVADRVAVGEVLGRDRRLELAICLYSELTLGLSSWSKVGAPTGVEPDAAVGSTLLSAAPVSGDDEVTSRWAPSSWRQ